MKPDHIYPAPHEDGRSWYVVKTWDIYDEPYVHLVLAASEDQAALRALMRTTSFDGDAGYRVYRIRDGLWL